MNACAQARIPWASGSAQPASNASQSPGRFSGSLSPVPEARQSSHGARFCQYVGGWLG